MRFGAQTHRFAGLSKGRIAKRGQRNKTEAEYEILLTADKDVADWWFEPFSLRLSSPEKGQPARYTPDFLVLMRDGTTYVDDVKGTGPDDAASIVRLKTAAEQYPLWRFRLCKKQKAGMGFKVTEV